MDGTLTRSLDTSRHRRDRDGYDLHARHGYATPLGSIIVYLLQVVSRLPRDASLPSVIPSRRDTNPGQRPTNPDQRPTHPEQPRPTPDQRRATPDQRRPTPTNARPTPDQRRATPDQRRPTPGQPRPTPDQPRPTPDQRPTNPEQPRPTPSNARPTPDQRPTNAKQIAMPRALRRPGPAVAVPAIGGTTPAPPVASLRQLRVKNSHPLGPSRGADSVPPDPRLGSGPPPCGGARNRAG